MAMIPLVHYNKIFSRSGRTRGFEDPPELTPNEDAVLDRVWRESAEKCPRPARRRSGSSAGDCSTSERVVSSRFSPHERQNFCSDELVFPQSGQYIAA